jgi:hypothetical protein
LAAAAPVLSAAVLTALAVLAAAASVFLAVSLAAEAVVAAAALPVAAALSWVFCEQAASARGGRGDGREGDEAHGDFGFHEGWAGTVGLWGGAVLGIGGRASRPALRRLAPSTTRSSAR